ncbi:MAG: putative DNA binding domain-containing protein [Arcanobacterium sp.]|nr:putative DNA binding domain-containing protein [Arcanobacterium sp.]
MNLGIETETLEFKKSTAELKQACISLCAMLNKHGLGTLFFGAKPDGTVIGQSVTEETLRTVSRSIYESIKPQIYPTVTKEILDEKECIKVEVNGAEAPYAAYGRYYLRTADEDRAVSTAQLRTMLSEESYKDSWELAPSYLMPEDMDANCVDRFLQAAHQANRLPELAGTAPDLASRLGLVTGDHLNRAGEFLFGNSRPVTLKLALLATPEKITFLDMRTEEGNIFELLTAAEQYVLKNINWHVSVNRMQREEIPELPQEAIREVIANSFAHARYQTNTTHEICVYPDRVTFYNPGRFANSYSPDEYVTKALPSVTRNELIAKTMYLSKNIERFGSGIRKVVNLCTDTGIRYAFDNGNYGFMVTLYRGGDSDVTTNVTTNAELTNTELAVLSLLMKNPRFTRKELASETSKTVRTIQRALNTLVAKGYIEKQGTQNEPVWHVRS